jgi:hypothetical protein
MEPKFIIEYRPANSPTDTPWAALPGGFISREWAEGDGIAGAKELLKDGVEMEWRVVEKDGSGGA